MKVDIDPSLYRAIRVEAARADRSVNDVVEEAIQRWLEALEEAEDIAAARAALIEHERDGGAHAGEVFQRLAAEQQGWSGSRE